MDFAAAARKGIEADKHAIAARQEIFDVLAEASRQPTELLGSQTTMLIDDQLEIVSKGKNVQGHRQCALYEHNISSRVAVGWQSSMCTYSRRV